MMPKAIGVYAYAGGFTHGIQQAGFTVDHQLENTKPYGARTTRLANGVLVRPDGRWAPDTIDAALVYSNPPCAVFSPSGYSAGKGKDAWQYDPRMLEHAHPVHVAHQVGAAAVVIESVVNSLRHARPFYTNLRDRFLDGWYLTPVEHNANRLGLPQNRPRVFWVFTQDPFDHPDMPNTIQVLGKGDLDNTLHPKDPQVRNLTPAMVHTLASVPQGKALRPYWNHPDGVTGKPSTACRRLAWGKPTPSMGGVRGYAHPDHPRYITTRDMKRICGYPDDYPFTGTPSQQVLEMCRAVMPPVGRWIGAAMLKHLQ